MKRQEFELILQEKDLKKDLKKEGGKMTENQKRIILEVKNNKFITQGELSKIIGINEKNVRNNIFKLKQKGLLDRVGSAKGGYWKLLK